MNDCKGIALAPFIWVLALVAVSLTGVIWLFEVTLAQEYTPTARTQELACVNALGPEHEQCMGAFLSLEDEIYLINTSPMQRSFTMRPAHAREYLETGHKLVTRTHPDWRRHAISYAEQFTVSSSEQ